MTLKSKLLPVTIAVVVILGSGYVHGVWSFRWSAARELNAAKVKVAKIPLNFGDWTGTENSLDERQAMVGRIYASISRQYVNPKTGSAISVLLVCGRPGPISVHTPEVCYAGSGYEIAGDRTKISVEYPGGVAQFWSIKVSKPDPTRPEKMVIDYGWFSDKKWTAPDLDSRLVFAGKPVLYKLYVIREQTRSDERLTFDPSAEFLKEFLPTIQKILDDPA